MPVSHTEPVKPSELNSKNPYKLMYQTGIATYYVQGGVSKLMDSLKITLVIEHLQTQQKSRNKIDLYEEKQVEKLCKEVAEKLQLRKDLLAVDVYKLTDLLEQYREAELSKQESQAPDQENNYPLTTQKGAYRNLIKETPINRQAYRTVRQSGHRGRGAQPDIFIYHSPEL